jgi:hypothetical protein
MSFFNNKEEVIEIELTQYGKKILSEGVFDPKFYSFFDEDIIYDSNCFSAPEEQNYTQTRILQETPYLKVQTKFSSSVYSGKFGERENNLLGASLNNVDDSIVYAPAINLQINGSTIDSVDFASDKWYNKFGSYIVPQIYLKEQMIDITADSDFSKKQLSTTEVVVLPVKDDDTYVKIDLKELIIDVFEENVDDLMKNFDIEIIRIDGEEVQKLSFDVQRDVETGVVIDGILYESTPGIQEFTSYVPDAPSAPKQADVNAATSYFNYSLDQFGDEGQISDKRLFIYDPLLYLPPNCD